MKEMKRILAIFLCLVMLVGVMPVSAFATEDLGGFFIPGGDKAASEDGSLGGFVIPGGKVEAEETTAPAEEETTAPAEEETTAPSSEPATEPTVATEEVEEEEAEQLDADGVTYVLAGSDFQASSHDAGATIVSGLLAKIKVDYPTMNGFLFAGDYDVNYNDSANGKAKLQETVQAVYGTGMDEIYVQGNHDSDSLVGSTLTASGANDAENYGVFVINEKDYMWYNNDEATIKKTAENLEAYLNAKRNAGYTKPIFVMSHLPLHYCMRTRSGGNDGMHANYIFDVLNEAGNAGLNIIFMFGHNHSHGWDDYLGGAAIFLTHDDKINIAQNSTTVFKEETLAFTYMNAGYVGYYGTSYTSDVDKTLTMTTFAITDTDVTISRYDSTGTHDLKSAGVYNVEYPDSAYYSTDTTTVGTPYTLTLNTEITPAGEEVEAPGSGNTGSGTATQRTYTRVTSTSELVSGGKYLIFYNGSHFMLPEVVEKSDGSVRKGFNIESTSICGPDTISGDYSAKEWVLTSSGSGWLLGNGTQYAKLTNTSNYKITATLETTGDTFTIGGSENAFTFSNGTYVFNYNDRGLINGYASDAATFYIYRMTDEGSSGGNVETSGGDWVTITEPTTAGTRYVYELDTNGVETGVEYLIVANGYEKALSAAASSNNAVDIEISGNYAYAASDTYGWTFTRYSNGVYYIRLNNSKYLALSNNSLGSSDSTGSSRRWTVTNNNDGSYDIVRNNYNLRWSNSNGVFQANSSSKGPVRLYKYLKTETTTAQDGLYGKVSGELTYHVDNGTSEADALAAVKAGIDILYHNGDENAAQTFPDDGEGMTWTIENYNGAVGGEYAVTIAYNGVTLGTAKVVVPSVNISGYEVDPMEGNVWKGSGQNATTYSTITVTLENGNYYTVPVTISMLSKDGAAITTDEEGTLTGLTVTYNGVVVAENYTLNVNAKPVNDYPTYPNEGAVKVGKTADGIDFQSTGVARVELSASGVPTHKGADVVVVIDTSSSMTDNDVGDTGKSRIQVLSESLEQMLEQFQAVGEDGSAHDISIAIIDFNGYFPSSARTVDQISFTGSYRDNADYAKVFTGTNAGSYIKNVGLSAGNFVSISSLNAATIAGQFTDGNCKSGTNYDGALKNAYDLLAAKKAANGEEERDQYVIFLSDGAPFRYNGFNNGSTKSTYGPWNNWLTGTWANAATFLAAYPNNTHAKNYNAFYNGNGTNHPHRYAEAIKGVEGQPYSVVQYTSSTTAELKEVNGLGAKIYSIGFGLADDGDNNGRVTVATQQELITVISSGAGYYYPNVQEAEELTDAFTKIVTDIRYAAYNARFADTMGEHYNIQLKPTVTRENGTVITLAETPKIEVRSYTIWTRAEYLAGKCAESQIGDRKTNSNGDYIYSTLETVTFNADGTEAYSNKETIGPDGTAIAASTDAAKNNILIDGVIYAASFWYNTKVKTDANSGVVAIDTDRNGTNDYDLPAESFYWSIGNIKLEELALSYYVHLDGSMTGKPAGSYPTNESAVLYYDNYVQHPCHKATVSPVLAWEAANVSYAFYLVNADGDPVNMDGTKVSFANRVAIVNPTYYDEILFNDIENGGVDAMTIVADDPNVLPVGYTLFDYDAKYVVQVDSDGVGNWTITKDADLVATTYVTDFSATVPYSKELTADTNTYDYTHTTVWFAVVWEPRALPDTVVIDYGLPVDVNVLTNDMFGSFGKLIGVAKGVVTNTDNNNSTNEVKTTSAQGEFGTATVIVPEKDATEANSVVRYALEGMQMNTAETFTYSVQYANTELPSNNGYYYGTLTVIPATTIYYEDDFVDLSTYTWDGGWVENDVSGWTLATDDTYTEGEDITQDEDRPDDVNYAFDTIIDADNVYGYDSSYTECSKYSLGSAAKATVDYNNKAEASFTFYGTGFDVISATNSDTGTIIVDVTDAATGESVHSYVVDTYYGYVMTENTSQTEENDSPWTFQLKRDASGLYQVPVIKVSGLPYGQYEAVITAQYSPAFDPDYDSSLSTEQNSYDFYLDAIRIYDPAGVVSGEDNDVIEDAYVKDNEAFPVYQELRNNILNKGDVDSGIPGAVFIDGIGVTASVEEYKEYGPNNEVYLNPGQAILFTTNLGDAADKLASLQIGLKAETQTAATYYIFDAATITGSADLKTLKPATVLTATDMYYDITALAGKNIVIYNSGDGILSITNLKATFTEASGLTEILDVVKEAAVKNFLNALNDGETGTGSDSGTGTNLAEVIKSIVGRLKGLFGNKG